MNSLLLITGGILFIIALALVYRIMLLVQVARGQAGKTNRVGNSNAINGLLFIAFFLVGFGLIFWYSGRAAENFLPEAASAHGVITDKLFWITTAIVFAVFFLTHVILFFAPFKYRYSEDRKAFWYPHNNKLEVIWTVIPAIVLTILIVSGWKVWSDVMTTAPKERVEVEIMGKQFNWQVRYAGKDNVIGKYDFRKIDATNSFGMDFVNDKANMDDFTPNEIHIPKGKNVLLKIRARDVLHSVFLPHFRVKMDAVPGMPTSFWFVPTISTAEMRAKLATEGKPNADKFDYELACTEICGQGHFAMRLKVIVDEPAEYEKWVASQKTFYDLNKEYVDKVVADAAQKEKTVASN
jgi:cytochrome c oxidase subunit 2